MAFYVLYSSLLIISSLWDYVPFNFKFARYTAALWTLDAIALNKARRSRGVESPRLPSEARAPKRTVDRVSGHRTLEILLRFGDCGRHVDASGASDQDWMGDYRGIMGSWPMIIVRSRPLIGLHQIGRSAIFADFFYKTVFFLSLYLNS